MIFHQTEALPGPSLRIGIERCGYRRGESTLRDVHLSLSAGRTVLLGPNGAGKSTLLKALAGVLPFSGTLQLDGRSQSAGRRTAEYRRAVGWLPQSVRPFPALTAREHVAYVAWLKGMKTAEAWSASLGALERVGLADCAGKKATQLSGGQTRRLGIAAVLAHGARVLLLDEPTSGLDPYEQDRFDEVLVEVERDAAVLVSTHDTATLIKGDSRVLVITDGVIRYAGGLSEFVSGIEAAAHGDVLRAAYARYIAQETR